MLGGPFDGQGGAIMTAPLLHGCKAIARHLHMSERQTRYLIRNDRIPTFRLGKVICSTADLLTRHFETLPNGGPQ